MAEFTVTANVAELAANTNTSFEVPRAPGGGEARPWFLSDQVARIGESAVLAPSFDAIVMPGEPVAFMGYACRSKDDPHESYTGSLAMVGGGAPTTVALTWMEPSAGSDKACGWLAGKLDAPLAPGFWTFKPPSNLGGAEESPGVEFNVAPALAEHPLGAGG